MNRIILAVSDLADAQDMRDGLATFGYRADVAAGCERTLDVVEQAVEGQIEAVVVDSRLIKILADDHRNLVAELQDRQRHDVPILVSMTKPISKVANPLVHDAVRLSDGVIHAPATAPDVYLLLRAIGAYRATR